MSGGLSGIDVDAVITIVIWSRANVPTALNAVRPSVNALNFWFIDDEFCAQWIKGSSVEIKQPIDLVVGREFWNDS